MKFIKIQPEPCLLKHGSKHGRIMTHEKYWKKQIRATPRCPRVQPQFRNTKQGPDQTWLELISLNLNWPSNSQHIYLFMAWSCKCDKKKHGFTGCCHQVQATIFGGHRHRPCVEGEFTWMKSITKTGTRQHQHLDLSCDSWPWNHQNPTAMT